MSEKIKAYEVDLNELRPDPSNANAGSERGQYMLDASVTETGLHRGVAVDANGYLVAGNKTHQAAIDAGFKRAIVVETDGDTLVVTKRRDFDLMDADPNNKARRAAYFDNRSSEVSMTWDTEQMLADMSAGLDLSSMFREDELDELLAGMQPEPEPVTDAGAQTDKAAELQAHWGTALGQLWQIGDHRLICGDCTDADVVARVMAGEKAALAIADPPYNVGYEYNSISDQMSRDDYRAWCGKYLDLMCHHSDMQIVTPGKANERLYEPKEWLTWYKGFGLSRGHFFKAMVTEPILLFGKKPTNKFYATDHFDFMTEREQGLRELHTCPKPVALWRALIEPMTEAGEIVYEPFSGSGTTIIACEQLGRKCRAVELSPAYVAVALQRFADSTGVLPVLVD